MVSSEPLLTDRELRSILFPKITDRKFTWRLRHRAVDPLPFHRCGRIMYRLSEVEGWLERQANLRRPASKRHRQHETPAGCSPEREVENV